MILPLIPGNDNPLDLSAGQDALQNAGAGMVDNDPFLANAARAAGGQKTQLGKDIFDHKLKPWRTSCQGWARPRGRCEAGTLAKIAGAERLQAGWGKQQKSPTTPRRLGLSAKRSGGEQRRRAGRLQPQRIRAQSLPAKISLPKVSLPKLKGKPLPPAPPEVVPVPSAAPLGPHR